MTLPETNADVIVAAGDIGIGTDAVRWLTAAEKPVVYVAGNHEFYTHEMLKTVSSLSAKTKDTKIRFLHNESTVIDGVRFLGCTLWTDFDHGNQELMAHAAKGMNDYAQIRYGSVPLSPSQILHTHLRSKKWLAEQIKTPFDGKNRLRKHILQCACEA